MMDGFFSNILVLLLRFPRLKLMPTPENPTVSILIPARNEAENLKRALPSVLRQGALGIIRDFASCNVFWEEGALGGLIWKGTLILPLRLCALRTGRF